MDLDEMLAASGITGGATSNKVLKSGFVTILGRPNVGKSTLMNKLIGQKIAITSNKPQTTRNRIRTVYTDERGQIVFVDTPGVLNPRNKLDEFMAEAVKKSLTDVDIILWIVEPTLTIGEAEKKIIEMLDAEKKPVVLVINKCDTVKRDEILPVIAAYEQHLKFADIVPVSARNGENVEELTKVLFDHLPEGPMYFDADTVTDQPVKQITAEIIREKALHALNQEIPHGIAVTVDSMKERKGRNGTVTDIDATIICERESHKAIVIGKHGAMLKKIGTNARYDIEHSLGMHANLKLWVKVRKEWRDNDSQLKNFGYDKKKVD